MIKKELCCVPYTSLTTALKSLPIPTYGGNLFFLAEGIRKPELTMSQPRVLDSQGIKERMRYEDECKEKGVIPFSSAIISYTYDEFSSMNNLTIENIHLENNGNSNSSTLDRAIKGGKPCSLSCDNVLGLDSFKGKDLINTIQNAGYLINSGKLVFSYRQEKEGRGLFAKKVQREDSFLDINSKLELVILLIMKKP